MRLSYSLAGRNLLRAHLALTNLTPLYQHRLVNASEYKMNEVSRKVEDGWGLPQHYPSLSAQTGLPRFVKPGLPLILVAFQRLLLRRYGGATGFLLKARGPYRFLGDEWRI